MKRVVAIFLLAFIFPLSVFAMCLPDGATVVFVNGVLNTQENAQDSTDDLTREFHKRSQLPKISIISGYNASHLGGAADLLQSVTQVLEAPLSSYDLKTILLQIHPQVTTQKILLVGHSQGTFYTNALYDYLVENGVSRESIAVYNLATPASFVSGGGAYLTSANDTLINKVREFTATVGAREPLPANILVPLPSGETSETWKGHGFSASYLGMKPVRIVSDIEKVLHGLKAVSTKDGGCFVPPDNDFKYKATGAFFKVGDPTVNSFRNGVVAVVNTTKAVAGAVGKTFSNLRGNNIAQGGAAALAVSGKVETPQALRVSQPQPANTSQLAVSVVAATAPATPPPQDTQNSQPTPSQNTQDPPLQPTPTYQHQYQPYQPGFGGGGGTYSAPQIQQDVGNTEEQNQAPPQNELVEVPADETPPNIPTASVSECNTSLSSDFCLIPNTTVTLVWNDALDATYYAPVQNDILGATTTATTTTLAIAINATTTLAVVAYDNAGNAATSTFISIHTNTQPLIISEVAWAGTDASASDEWLELYNITNFSINLSDIMLAAVDSVPKITLSGSLAPGAYYLIERTDDNSVASIAGNLVVPFSGSGAGSGLSNDGEELLLIHRFGTSFATTIDRTPAVATCSGWCAGTVSVLGLGASSMERVVGTSDGSLAVSWKQAKLPAEPAKDSSDKNICGTPGEGVGSDDCPMPILPGPPQEF